MDIDPEARPTSWRRLRRLIRGSQPPGGWVQDRRALRAVRRSSPTTGSRRPPSARTGPELVYAAGDALYLTSHRRAGAPPPRARSPPGPRSSTLPTTRTASALATIDIEARSSCGRWPTTAPELLRRVAAVTSIGGLQHPVASTPRATRSRRPSRRRHGRSCARWTTRPASDPLRCWRAASAVPSSTSLPTVVGSPQPASAGVSLWPLARERYPHILRGHSGVRPAPGLHPRRQPAVLVSPSTGRFASGRCRHASASSPESSTTGDTRSSRRLADMDVVPRRPLRRRPPAASEARGSSRSTAHRRSSLGVLRPATVGGGGRAPGSARGGVRSRRHPGVGSRDGRVERPRPQVSGPGPSTFSHDGGQAAGGATRTSMPSMYRHRRAHDSDRRHRRWLRSQRGRVTRFWPTHARHASSHDLERARVHPARRPRRRDRERSTRAVPSP